jgi:integrase
MNSERIKVGSVSLPFWQHERGWRWSWKDKDGRRRYGTRLDKAEAKEAARAQARTINNGALNLADLSPSKTELVLQFLALDPTAADVARLREWRAESKTTLAAVVAKWSASKLAEMHGTETPFLRSERLWLEKAAKTLTGPASAITEPMLRRYIEAAHDNPKSRRDARARIILVWKYARTHGLFESQEADKLPVYRRAVQTAVDVWTPDEMRRLLDACPVEFRPWLCIAAFSGCRSEEIAPKPGKPGLEWRHIGAEFIEVPAATSKVRKRRLVPITPTLAAWLATIPEKSGLVCPRLPSAHVCGLLGRSVGGWRKNALRHSYGSYRAATTKDLPALAIEMGTSVAMIEKHYREATTPEVAEKWWALLP